MPNAAQLDAPHLDVKTTTANLPRAKAGAVQVADARPVSRRGNDGSANLWAKDDGSQTHGPLEWTRPFPPRTPVVMKRLRRQRVESWPLL